MENVPTTSRSNEVYTAAWQVSTLCTWKSTNTRHQSDLALVKAPAQSIIYPGWGMAAQSESVGLCCLELFRVDLPDPLQMRRIRMNGHGVSNVSERQQYKGEHGADMSLKGLKILEQR